MSVSLEDFREYCGDEECVVYSTDPTTELSVILEKGSLEKCLKYIRLEAEVQSCHLSTLKDFADSVEARVH